MARTLKTLPEDLYVVETTVNGRFAHDYITLLGPYTTLAQAKGQATASEWGDRKVTARFFKGAISWEEMV